jgi:hypothetical protein
MRHRTRRRGGCDPRGLGDHCVDCRAGHTKFADDWLAAAPGTDGALAMAMGHVILTEFYRDRQVPYFTEYAGRRPAAVSPAVPGRLTIVAMMYLPWIGGRRLTGARASHPGWPHAQVGR